YLRTQAVFYVVIALGLALVLVTGFRGIGVVRGTQTFPVTSQVLSAFTSNLYFLGLITTLYCSSVLLWRRRSWHVNEILDALPAPGWVDLLGKVGAMIAVHALLMSLVMAAGIGVQAARGFYDFQPSLYVTELFGVQLVYYSLISVFALFAQVLTGNRLAGFIVTMFFIDDFMAVIGLEHSLWTFAARPAYVISDMNGYGPFASAIAAYDIYWAFFSVLLLVVTGLLYPRGLDTSLRQRLKGARERLSRGSLALAAPAVAGCLVAGGVILYNTTDLNSFETGKRKEARMARYEKIYKRWEQRVQPDIAGIETRVDIYPEQRRCAASGSIRLVNRSGSQVDTLFVQVPGRPSSVALSTSMSSRPAGVDQEHGVYLFELDEPMEPGSTGELSFEIEIEERGFKDRDVNTRLVGNGTFLTVVHILPATGYDPYGLAELSDNDKRERHGLPPAPRLAPAGDAEARKRMPMSSHGGWIDFETVVSTSGDQTALAPGELVREWEDGGRRYFHYRAPGRILNYLAFISGRYEVRRERHGGTDIEIYYHPGHPYNIDLMSKSAKASLDYFGREFGPYQFPTLRLVEFPRYMLFAEAFPGLIPISEGYGFIARYDEERLKEAFRVVAHEVGHQWWAHQVIGADVEGFYLLSEVMAQYSALVVSKSEYDRDVFDEYVRYEIGRYLGGRGAEVVEEVPLVRTNGETWYQHYAKGFVVMNALAEYAGEEAVNSAARRFVEKHAFRGAPYPVAGELVDLFREAVPDSVGYFVEDCFERIVLFDNEAVSADCLKTEDGRYRIELSYEIRKWIADGKGEETEANTRDLVEFAVFGRGGEELCRERRWVEGGEGQIVMVVDGLPARAGVDPHHLLMDKNVENNRIDVVRR
ncbi:MAG TPA: M1 family aminopeptidase, partial [Candidatus Krumholzibacterium sp.]|nr:M1 family aminopeptidase [Candidatus Krumholzibacterium sp.]